MKSNLFFIAAFLIIFASLHFPDPINAEIVSLPELKERVTDLTGTLKASEKASLESRLKAYETEKGTQIVILILHTTGDESIEQFGIRLAEEWKIGRKGIGDGVILIVAKDDRKLRIEVGYGLEGSLTDVTAWRIINEIIVPQFKSGSFYEGINSGTEAIISVISGEVLPEPSPEDSFNNSEEPSSSLAGKLPFLIIFAIFIGMALRNLFGKGVSFVVVAAAVFLIALFIVPIWLAIIAGLLLGGFAALAGSGTGGTGYYGGGFSSGGFGGGGFGSGGFGGGGGGFGGGGASGSW